MISETLYVARCLTQIAIGIHGTEGLGSKKIVQGLSEVGLDSEPDLRAADATFEEGYAHARDARNGPSFADSLAPTLEEKILAEHRLPVQNEYGMMSVEKNLEGEASELSRSAPGKARVDSGHLSGAPTGPSLVPEADTQLPQVRVGKKDADAEPPRARTLRKQLSTKPGQSSWTILTPKPKYDANSFEDPVSDKFWTDIWVACAVHNVSRLCIPRNVVANMQLPL